MAIDSKDTAQQLQSDSHPTALFVIGPGAVGKYAVGKAIAEKLSKKWAFAHNHQAIELAYGMYPGAGDDIELDWQLVDAVRKAVSKRLIEKGDNIIYTAVVRFDDVTDFKYFSGQALALKASGYRVCVAALCASMEDRVIRNKEQSRLDAKPSKRNISKSEGFMHDELEQNVLEYPTKEQIEDIFGCGLRNIVIVDTVRNTVSNEADEIIDVLGLEA